MKERMRQSLTRPPYNVMDFYKKKGLWQRIARSSAFETVTLVVIAFNAIWMAVDTDHNTSEVLLEAHPVFQVMEHFFCTFFAVEWLVRFLSFKNKRDGLKDVWFSFDTVLVIISVLETWVMTTVMWLSGSSGKLGNASILRLVRLVRLVRMARMARLLRAMPEIMVLVKGMATAMRSVFFTLCLLVLITYVFAIIFTQLTAGTSIGNDYFASVLDSMYTLVIRGTLLDNIGKAMDEISQESTFVAAIFMLFVLLAALTVMNMLIGVLCEVVSVVAAVEKEEMAVNFVKARLHGILRSLDKDGDGMISKTEFEKLLENPDTAKAFQDVGVDSVNLVDNADFIFESDATGGECDKNLSFADFMEVVLQFRGTNTATVKEIVNLRKFIRMMAMQTNGQVQETTARRVSLTVAPFQGAVARAPPRSLARTLSIP
eukprot:CAMPEP_0180490978 /NCGR_PEP_ID=MMETSP1036_2-20121128/39405_1 /TAXON_ID=632150 /ORGANISM="Azadinium spinosum, Strain 3D9" /LENGTH=429 /DNA_ID=CAMNT_0022499211 /DNA_START=1 /DNA_END=1290 /DNA_ORIENTATION=-